VTPEQVAGLIALVDWGSRLGFTGGVVLVVIGAVREWWVPGSVHRRALAEANGRERFWQDKAMEWAGLVDRGTRVAETVVDRLPK
jgi:hypothetical protein